ncbi:MAG: Fe-S cluster assembly sulfur transfer protein SufU [Pseudomonadota bacterium]
MSDDLLALYRDKVLAHSRDPCNFCRLDDADHVVSGSNPLCGDSLQVYIALDGDHVRALSFEGHGCAISVASASMMTQMLEGCSCCDAVETIERVNEMLTSGDGEALDAELAEQPVAALAAVRRYPTRIKCATLAWQAVRGALTENADTVTTE